MFLKYFLPVFLLILLGACGTTPEMEATQERQRQLAIDRHWAEVALHLTSSPAEKHDAIQKIQSNEVLLDIARKRGKYWNKYPADLALDKIEDQGLLVAIAMGKVAAPESMQISAIRKIKNPEVLKNFYLQGRDPDDKKAEEALRKINDLDWLLEQVPAHPVEHWRQAGEKQIQRVKDDRTIAQIETTQDLAFLRDQALTNKNSRIRWLARKKIDHQPTLYEILLKADLENESKESVLRRITDQTLLAQFALEPDVGYLQFQAIEQITDPDILEHLALSITKDDKSIQVGRETKIKYWDRHIKLLLEKITSQESLTKIVEEAPLYRMRLKAVKLLDESDTVHRAALEEPTWEMREAAVSVTRNQDILARIYRKDKEWPVRFEALKHIDNQTVLKQAAISGKHHWERLMATVRINAPDFLATLLDKPDGQGAIAALNLALIETKIPVELNMQLERIEKRYGGAGSVFTLYGERIHLHISEANTYSSHEIAFTTKFHSWFSYVGSVDKLTGKGKKPYQRFIKRADMSLSGVTNYLASFLKKALSREARDQLFNTDTSSMLQTALTL